MKKRLLIFALLSGAAVVLIPHRLLSQETAQGPLPTRFDKPGPPPRGELVIARLRVKGSDLRVDPMSDFNLAQGVRERTNIRVKPARMTITLNDDGVFAYPFLMWNSENFTNALSEPEQARLRKHLTHGGFLFIDDCGAKLTLRRDLRPELNRLFPDRKLERIPLDHPLYHCYYDIPKLELSGTMRQPWHEGIFIDGRLVLVYTVNAEG